MIDNKSSTLDINYNLSISSDEVLAFLDRIEVHIENPSIQFLENIVQQTMAMIPFQNLSMLIRPRNRPSWGTIKSDMIDGSGGLCTSRNPFLKALLQKLGFDTWFVSSSMDKPDCHIGICVNLEDSIWWVDIGNGYPYLKPYQLGSEKIINHPFMDFRIIEEDGLWLVQHRMNSSKKWIVNQRFKSDPVDYHFFDSMHENHYTKVGWGPFLSGIRINRWTSSESIILRDKRASSSLGECTINSDKELNSWINSNFPTNSFRMGIDEINAWNTIMGDKI